MNPGESASSVPSAAPTYSSLNKGFWRISQQAETAISCPYSVLACAGGVFAGDISCYNGFSGPLCALATSHRYIDYIFRDSDKCTMKTIFAPLGLMLPVAFLLPIIVFIKVKKINNNVSSSRLLAGGTTTTTIIKKKKEANENTTGCLSEVAVVATLISSSSSSSSLFDLAKAHASRTTLNRHLMDQLSSFLVLIASMQVGGGSPNSTNRFYPTSCLYLYSHIYTAVTLMLFCEPIPSDLRCNADSFRNQLSLLVVHCVEILQLFQCFFPQVIADRVLEEGRLYSIKLSQCNADCQYTASNTGHLDDSSIFNTIGAHPYKAQRSCRLGERRGRSVRCCLWNSVGSHVYHSAKRHLWLNYWYIFMCQYRPR